MAKCFCGCGRTIRFRGRIPNSYGKTAQMFTTRLDEIQSLDRSDPDVQTFLQDGKQWYDSYAAAAHGDIDIDDLDRGEWLRWRRTAFKIVRDEEKTTAKIGRAYKKSGMTPEEFLRTVGQMAPHTDVPRGPDE